MYTNTDTTNSNTIPDNTVDITTFDVQAPIISTNTTIIDTPLPVYTDIRTSPYRYLGNPLLPPPKPKPPGTRSM